MPHPIRFGDRVAPTQEWANAWESGFRSYMARVLAEYRSRVRSYWHNEFRQKPDHFVLAGPVEVAAVVTLAAAMIFVRPAEDDSVRVEQHWEHEEFADWEFMQAPDVYRHDTVATTILGGIEWQLLSEWEIAGGINATMPTPQFYDPERFAQGWADAAASVAQYDLLVACETLDFAALARVREDIDRLDRAGYTPKRGSEFEAVIERLLSAHGCRVERCLPGESEQVDLFMTEPEFVLIECRWKNEALQPEVIYNIAGKLAKRPSFVNGLYVSMSGYTDGAKTQASDTRNRTVVLIERDEVLSLARGDVTFRAFWQHKLRELLLRYKG